MSKLFNNPKAKEKVDILLGYISVMEYDETILNPNTDKHYSLNDLNNKTINELRDIAESFPDSELFLLGAQKGLREMAQEKSRERDAKRTKRITSCLKSL